MIFKIFLASLVITVCHMSPHLRAQGLLPGAPHLIELRSENGGHQVGEIKKFIPVNKDTLGVLLKAGRGDRFLLLGFYEVEAMQGFMEALRGTSQETYSITRSLDDNDINDLEDPDFERETAAAFGSLGFKPLSDNFHLVFSPEVINKNGHPLESTAETEARLYELFASLPAPDVSETRQNAAIRRFQETLRREEDRTREWSKCEGIMGNITSQ